jgi:nucleotidyltransferase/DNA polymerase involved in DNA repair
VHSRPAVRDGKAQMPVITPKMGPSFVEMLPVEKFPGVGSATTAKMNQLWIATGRDLRAQTLPFLQQHRRALSGNSLNVRQREKDVANNVGQTKAVRDLSSPLLQVQALAAPLLVRRFSQIDGYRCLSLIRALAVVNCQSALA